MGRLVKILTNSKLASREDVKGALTVALEAAGLGGGAATGPVVRQLDQILFKGVYPSNMWLVEVGTREAAQRLTRQGQVQAPCGNLRVEEVSAVRAVRAWAGLVCRVGPLTDTFP